MRAWLICLLSTALLAACGRGQPRILGRAPGTLTQSVDWVKKAPASASATVRGVMVQKCPAAGCWFVLRDPTGTIKVDTKLAGFVVVDVPLQTTLTVTGTVVTDGAERLLQAAGLSY